jgi:hypothetical protein
MKTIVKDSIQSLEIKIWLYSNLLEKPHDLTEVGSRKKGNLSEKLILFILTYQS